MFRNPALARPLSIILVGIALALSYSLCQPMIVLLLTFFSQSSEVSEHAPSTAMHILTPAVSVLAASTTIGSVSSTTAIPSVQTPFLPKNGATVDGHTDLARLLSTAVVEGVNRSEHFQVQILGDCHMIVKTPQKVLQKRKAPKIIVRVQRGRTEIPSNVSKVFDGVYTVRIDRDNAHGPLNVTIIVAKPLINETYELDFGHPWLKRGGWKQAAKMLSEKRAVVLESARRLGGRIAMSAQEARQMSDTLCVSLHNLTQQAHDMSEELCLQFIKQRESAAKLLTTNGDYTVKAIKAYGAMANEGRRAIVGRLVSNLKYGVNGLGNSASRIGVGSVRDQLQGLTRLETMAKAQERAKQIIYDSGTKLKEHREQTHQRRKVHKNKRAKKAWHGNERTNR